MSIAGIVLWSVLGAVGLIVLAAVALIALVAWGFGSILRQEKRSAERFVAAWNPETKTFDGLEFRDGEWREVTE